MRVAIIGSRGYPYVYSGYETFVKEVAERLVKRDVEVTVYCHRNLFKARPSSFNGIKLVYPPTIEKKSLSQLLHSFQSMVHAVLTGQEVILVVNTANGPFGVISRLTRTKTAINTDGLEWLRPKWRGNGAKYFYWASRMATRFYDVLVADSIEMQRIYRKEFGAESRVIAYGANIRYSTRPELLHKWNLKKETYYLIVGRLIPDNNSDIIIREFLSSSSKKKLVVVGDVPYKDEFATKIKGICDERIIFTGYVTDANELDELFLNSFAYIHGHEFGGTNPTMLTALACGCPVIALDTPFTREMCDNDSHALYFNKQRGNLQRTLEAVEGNAYVLDRMRETARSRIEQNYTWDKIADEYLRLFEDMLRAKNNHEQS